METDLEQPALLYGGGGGGGGGRQRKWGVRESGRAGVREHRYYRPCARDRKQNDCFVHSVSVSMVSH